MPIYEYRCGNGHEFEVLQSMTDDPVTACRECGAPVDQVFHPVAIHFKGSGFYSTDYGKGGVKRPAGAGDSTTTSDSSSSEKSSASADSKSDSAKSSESKPSVDKKKNSE